MSDPTRQGLAETDRPTNEIELRGDEQLFRALVSGCHVENAAVVAGISERTAYRRLADSKFRKQIDDARRSLRESILARLADSGHDAISALSALMHDSDNDAIRLKAAKTLLDALLTIQRPESRPTGHRANVQATVGELSIFVSKTDSEAVISKIDSSH